MILATQHPNDNIHSPWCARLSITLTFPAEYLGCEDMWGRSSHKKLPAYHSSELVLRHSEEESNTYLSDMCVLSDGKIQSEEAVDGLNQWNNQPVSIRSQKWLISFRCSQKATQYAFTLRRLERQPTQWKNKQSHTKVTQSESQAEEPEPGKGTESFWTCKSNPLTKPSEQQNQCRWI